MSPHGAHTPAAIRGNAWHSSRRSPQCLAPSLWDALANRSDAPSVVRRSRLQPSELRSAALRGIATGVFLAIDRLARFEEVPGTFQRVDVQSLALTSSAGAPEGAWHLLESRHVAAWSPHAGRDSRQCLAPQPPEPAMPGAEALGCLGKSKRCAVGRPPFTPSAF